MKNRRNNFIIERVVPDYNPKKTGKAYKVFKVRNGKLYPPMVANPGGEDTPIGVWLEAEEGEFAGLSKTGRKQVKSIGSGTLSYRPGWHLGDIPRASQFDRTNKETGEKEFPKDFIWAECDYVMDVDYQKDSDEQGYMRSKPDGSEYRSNKYQHSLAGLTKLPKDGYYRYRTNPRPDTVPWVITGAIKVNKLLGDDEVAEILKNNGVEPIHRQGGDKTKEEIMNNTHIDKSKMESLKESDDNSLFNENGELRNHKTAIFKSKNGIYYFVHNAGGDYEVWVRKSVPAPGGNRLKDFFRPVTAEIRNKIKLEDPNKQESLKEAKYGAYSGDELEGEVYDFLDELGGYADYNGKVDAVAEEFGMTKEEAESFVWEWSSAIDEDGFDDDLAEEDHESIVGWIEDHDQAYEDACSFFDTEDLSEVPLHDLIDWFADHKSLVRDIELHYGEPIVSKYFENESLKESRNNKDQEVIDWWRSVEDWNWRNGNKYNISNDEEDPEGMFVAMWDMLDEIKDKNPELYKSGRKIYDKYGERYRRFLY